VILGAWQRTKSREKAMTTNESRLNAVRVSIAMTVFAAASAATAASGPEPTAPPGVTLVEVVRELPISQPEVLWVRPGDADGRTLFISKQDEAGVSKCLAECATEFPPLLATRGAKPSGDWSLISRKDGGRQWTYQSHPLYTWSKEQVPGEVATNVGLNETANSKLAENAVMAGSLLPPAGWEVARFLPSESMVLPDGVEARLVHSSQAVALTDAAGFTLYSFAGDVKREVQACATSACEAHWLPVAAPAIASNIGDFSVVTRTDGSKQWAYRKRPLFTNSADTLPGDINGAGVDAKFSVATITQNFQPAQVAVTRFDGYGAALTLNGKTLYGGYSFEKRWGGRNLRDTFTNAYYKGKKLGAAACVDDECLAKWKPFVAPANAVASGFWEPIQRADGTKQWAYKGYALYTYAGDTAPGQHNGQATYDFAKVEGEGYSFKRVAYLQEISKASGGIGVYWNIAKP
jgi:predicted lipoprotein with Yx(FWY)xxD motif